MSSLTSLDPMREKYYAVYRKKQQSTNALLALLASSSKICNEKQSSKNTPRHLTFKKEAIKRSNLHIAQ